MRIARRALRRLIFSSLACLILATPLAANAAERPRLHINDYVIDAEIFPATHKLVARAKVNFTALEDLSIAVFELHNDLHPTKITDAAGKPLSPERVTQDSSLRIPLPNTIAKGTTTTFNFDYEGTLATADDSPVEGLKLAYVGPDITELLYAGRWFPVVGYGTERFTSTINVTVPTEMRVVGSGVATKKPGGPGKTTYIFTSTQPSFPGTIIAGIFNETATSEGGATIRTFFRPNKSAFSANYAATAGKEFNFYSGLFGAAPATDLNIVELPDDSVPSTWAPQIAGLASRDINDKGNYRLLANAIAHQWWGVAVSPATRDDFWIQDGGARYSEVRYVENASGESGFEEATRDMAVGALAYDNIPLSSVGKLDMFSPEFQQLTTDKGGMIFHMLRWVMGTADFDRAVKNFLLQNAGRSVKAQAFEDLAQSVYAEGNKEDTLTPFFSQWLDGTGAPEFKNKYAVYRVAKGFRVTGEITQDLDLFRMPMEIRVDTDGQPEMKRIEVVGTRSTYAVNTFGKPRRISIDPNNWVLKESPDLKVRVAILRGQQAVQQGDYASALTEFNKALKENSNSSLAHYRIAEVFFLQHNYQASANAYRESLNGDGEPRWTEVWSHIQLGKIFDVTGQRERATNEYRQALQTNDNTQGALDEARRYMQAPYKKQASNSGQ